MTTTKVKVTKLNGSVEYVYAEQEEVGEGKLKLANGSKAEISGRDASGNWEAVELAAPVAVEPPKPADPATP